MHKIRWWGIYNVFDIIWRHIYHSYKYIIFGFSA